jgi:hypothetical protein
MDDGQWQYLKWPFGSGELKNDEKRAITPRRVTFQASSPKPLGRLEPNIAGMFLGWSSTKLLFFVPVGYSIWLPRPIILTACSFLTFPKMKLT